MASSASIAFVNGRIWTARRWVEALLAVEGVVVTAGTDDAVRRDRPDGTPTVDLEGHWLLPGLVDAHFHLADTVVGRSGADLAGARSISELREGVVAQAEGGPAGRPLLARGWDEGRLAERRYPTRDDLDRWPVEAPVVLYRTCDHVAVVNSRALERLGLDDASPDPEGGRLGREGHRLTGVLFEGALARLRPIQSESFAAERRRVGPMFRELARVGLTTIAPMSAEPEEVSLALDSLGGSRLPIRLRPYVRFHRLAEARRSVPARLPWVHLAGVKLVADGSLGARTAWLERPYDDAPGVTGMGTLRRPALDEALSTAATLGLPVAIHAIGDAAVGEALAALEAAPVVGVPRIEHASVTPPEVFAALRRVRPVLVVQPRFLVSDTWLAERLGPARARWTYAFRTLLAAGLTMAGSSDSPIEPFDPWTGIRAASSPRLHGPSERLDQVSAFALYTSGAGRALGEPELGSLEVGCFADAVRVRGRTWSDVLALGAEGVETTYLAGEPTFERRAEPASAAQRA